MLKIRQQNCHVTLFRIDKRSILAWWAKTSLETSSGIPMAPHSFSKAEKTRCVIWIIERYGDIAVQSRFWTKYFDTVVRLYFEQKLGSRWIGRGGSFSWLPRSLDLTSCNFLSCGYIKDRVFSDLPSTIPELRTSIRANISPIAE